MAICLAQQPDADALLDRDPFALLLGMLLDQQFPMERAFAGPVLVAQRLGRETLDVDELATYDEGALVEVFRGPPAVHRYPGSMAQRTRALAAVIVEQYDGDAANIWRDVTDGGELFGRLAALPGFGRQKAQIFTALLGKQRGVTPEGWREAAGGYGEDGVHKSVADVVDAASLVRVRDYKQEQKAAAKAAKAAGTAAADRAGSAPRGPAGRP
ncbi:HhH-GPD-type base excision DNA repair protein [Pseudonocardia sp.]|uniref:HhH-GPD-type base excision DNA repair protein n=1 Tax=Pseudonocardia sp. TaxID=60912 RepID=UPI003D14526E